MKENKKKIIIIISILTFLLIVIGSSYAFLTYSKIGRNQELIVGDVYMHYKEGDKSINIKNVESFQIGYILNTSEEAVSKCINYLRTTYGDEWNGLYYRGSMQEKNELGNYQARFMDTDIENHYYDEYCSGSHLYVEQMKNLKNGVATVKPLATGPIYEERYILNDYSNGIFTEADKTYFLENEIIVLPQDTYFEFTIDGKNTHTKNNILYNIQLTKGDLPEGRTEENRILDEFLRFRFVEVINNKETILLDNKSYSIINNTTIYSDFINSNTNQEIIRTYRLYMWLDNDIVVGNTDRSDYSFSEWENLFASVKVNVNGEYREVENLTNKIKNKLGTEGVVAVNQEGDLYDGTGTIREYRYSGIGNYCTYTDGENDYNLSVEGNICPTNVCKLGDGSIFSGSCKEEGTLIGLKTNEVHDSGLRNYILFNDELWRIVGVFGDNVKIVKDTPLKNDIYTSETYTSTESGVEYNLKYERPGTKYGYFIFKEVVTDGSYNSDWTTSGVKSYLNEETGYLGTIKESSRKLIDETTYYLGNVTEAENADEYWSINGLAKTIYQEERNEGNIWEGNQGSWIGKIALLYPSDYGYASATSNWNKNMSESYKNGISFNNWMFHTDTVYTWFLSPSSDSTKYVFGLDYTGCFVSDVADSDGYGSLLPVLNLKSNAMIVGGEGSHDNPYRLVEG